MPYRKPGELAQALPPELRQKFMQFSDEAQVAALDAFNGCAYESEGASEQRCMQVAMAAGIRQDGGDLQQEGMPPGDVQEQERGGGRGSRGRGGGGRPAGDGRAGTRGSYGGR